MPAKGWLPTGALLKRFLKLFVANKISPFNEFVDVAKEAKTNGAMLENITFH